MKSYQEMKNKFNVHRDGSNDFDDMFEIEMSFTRQRFLNSIKDKFKEYDLHCVFTKIDKDLNNVFLTLNNIPMRLVNETGHFKMIFQQYRIIVKNIPGLAANPNLKKLFPQISFRNIESVAKHFEINDLVNILKQYSSIDNLAKTGMFENVSFSKDEDDGLYKGHFSSEYSKLLKDTFEKAHFEYVEKIIKWFKEFGIECIYDDEGAVPTSQDPVFYFHVAGIPMQLRGKNKLTFELYEKIKLDRPELRLIDKNIFYENSQLRNFFSIQECVEYFKKHDLLNKKLNPIARTGIFEKKYNISESDNTFPQIEQKAKIKYEEFFHQEITKIFQSKGLKCEFIKKETGDEYFLVEGILMRILNKNRMLFCPKEEIIKYLPEISLTKLNDDNNISRKSILSEWHDFYSIDEVVDHFEEHDIVNVLKDVKNLNAISKTGVFEKIKSFKDFEKG